MLALVCGWLEYDRDLERVRVLGKPRRVVVMQHDRAQGNTKYANMTMAEDHMPMHHGQLRRS